VERYLPGGNESELKLLRATHGVRKKRPTLQATANTQKITHHYFPLWDFFFLLLFLLLTLHLFGRLVM
jgi:hypothetical protein